jgi:hypothetical protein
MLPVFNYDLPVNGVARSVNYPAIFLSRIVSLGFPAWARMPVVAMKRAQDVTTRAPITNDLSSVA